MNRTMLLVALLALGTLALGPIAGPAAASHPCMTSVDCAASQVLMKPSCILQQKVPALAWLLEPFCRHPL